MFDRFHPKKFYIFFSICLLILAAAFFLLSPFKNIFANLANENKRLQIQWQNQNKALSDLQNTKNKLLDLQKLSQTHQADLKKFSSLSAYFSQIAQMAKAYHLALIELKPKATEQISDFNKQIFSLEISGAEKSVWLFLQALFHQTPLMEIIKLDLKKASAEADLQVFLAVYYASTN